MVDNDVRVAVLGEFRRGAGRPYRNLLGVFVGTGVGGGLVLGGRLREGRGAAGEIGHTVVKDGGRRCSCGRRGHLEAYAGRGSMERTARRWQARGRRTVLFEVMEEKGRDRLTSGVIAAALKEGDPMATRLVDQAVWALGLGLASAQNPAGPRSHHRRRRPGGPAGEAVRRSGGGGDGAAAVRPGQPAGRAGDRSHRWSSVTLTDHRETGESMHAAIYARLSQVEELADGQVAQQANLDQQRDKGTELAASRGWSVHDTYVDAGRSAFKDGGKRPEFQRLLTDVLAGKVDVVIVRHLDRLYRDAIKALGFKAMVDVVAYDQSIDTTTGNGDFDWGFYVHAGQAQSESETKSKRSKAHRERMRDAGRSRSGGPRAYGFEPDGVTPRQTERRLIRKSARLIANEGASIRSIVKLWDKAGVHTSKGTPVQAVSIRRVLIADGERIMNREAPVILDSDIAIRVRDILMDPRRLTNREGLNRKHFMLNGLVRCECGGRMYGVRVGRARGLYYRCHQQDGGCGRTYIKAANVEEYVRASVETNRAELPAEGPDLTAEETALRERLASVEARDGNKRRDYALDLIDAQTLKIALDEVNRERVNLRRQLADLAHRRAAQETVHEFVARMHRPPEDFDGARQLIHATVERVTVRGAGQRNDVHPRDRVSITWRPEFSADEYGRLDAEGRDRPGPGDVFEMAEQLTAEFTDDQIARLVIGAEVEAELTASEAFRTLDKDELRAKILDAVDRRLARR